MATGKRGPSKGRGGLSVNVLATAALVAVAAAYFAYRGREYFKPPVLSPLKAPKLTDLWEFDASYKDQMLWGSYRSGLYFGMRMRAPKGLVSGLLWFDPDDPNTLNQMRARHEASQGDQLTTYGWKRHDGRTYGTQELVDAEYNITLSMLKSFSPESGPGGDWSVRLQLARVPGVPSQRRRISVVLYLADEDVPREPWQVLPDGEVTDLRSGPATLLTGASSALGRSGARWALHAMQTSGGGGGASASSKSRGCRLDYLGLSMENKDYLLRVKELMLSTMWERLERQPTSNRFHLYLPNGASTSSDLAMFQLTCSLPSTVDFAFTSSAGDSEAWGDRLDKLLGPGLGDALAAKRAEFDERFERVFGAGLHQQPSGDGDTGSTSGALPDGTLEVSRAALSNLLGSIGYFYGSSLVRTRTGAEPEKYWPAALFTAVPSRSFFPRGFLWDEGFHQLLVQRWDPQLSRDIIAHWLDLMNAQGWIPREQILGEEARARVPAEFVVQNPSHANPPSLFLPIAKMAAQVVKASAPGGEGLDGEELARVSAFLRRAWPRLETWYRWFNVTQAGPLPSSFRWHGRDALATGELNPKTLTSGLDDYPRASHPDDSERHLDLRCWMALASQAMYDIGSSLGLPAPAVKRYHAAAEALSDLEGLKRLHFDEALGRFADWGNHTEAVQLASRVIKVPTPEGHVRDQTVMQRVSVSSVGPAPAFVPQYGYVSLFPLIMKLLPGDARSGGGGSGSSGSGGDAALTLQQLALLQEPSLLWSPYGLRSLAASASLYKKRNTADDPPYWRGQIWININYLVLRALAHYAAAGGEVGRVAAAAHDELRLRLLRTLVDNYMRYGYLYEQYDDETGRGMSSHPFTGWTALVTLIAAQDY